MDQLTLSEYYGLSRQPELIKAAQEKLDALLGVIDSNELQVFLEGLQDEFKVLIGLLLTKDNLNLELAIIVTLRRHDFMHALFHLSLAAEVANDADFLDRLCTLQESVSSSD